MISRAMAETPMQRLVKPEDVAKCVDFLTSDASNMVTGQSLVVDGGASLLA
jgi:enoyl-[acyl-carrier protein] reductase III